MTESAAANVVPPPSIQVSMRRPHLDGVETVRLPDGYRIRCARSGDAPHWRSIRAAAFAEPVAEDAWDQEILRRPGYAAENVFFLIDAQDRACGTASAMRNGDETCVGYVHWVAILPDLAGQGLGYQLMLQVLNRFRALGYTSAVLDTHTFRLAAIRTYLRLGFQPWCRSPEAVERWLGIRAATGWSIPLPTLESIPP